MSRPLPLLILLLVASVASLFVALMSGTFPISALQVIDSVIFPAPGVVHDVIWQMRGPRAAAVFGCGALLALTGALLQILSGTDAAGSPGLRIWSVAGAGALLAAIVGASVALVHVGTLSTAAAVLLAGSVGFLGLMAAHILRGMGIVGRGWVLLLAVLLGGSALTFADAMAR